MNGRALPTNGGVRLRLAAAILALLILAPLVAALSPPSAPTGPAAIQGAAPGTIELNWTAPASSGASPVAGYRIYRSLTSTGLSPHLDIGNVVSFTDSGIPDGAPRFYRISALNGDGEGPLSPVVNASALAPPATPRSFSAAASGRGNLTFTWLTPLHNGSSDVTSYRVYRSVSENGTYALLGSPVTRIFNDTGHPDNTTLWYRVSAVNALGEGPSTPAQSHRTAKRPDVPVNLTADSLPGLGIQLVWEPPYDDGGLGLGDYRIYRKIGSDPEKVWATARPHAQQVTDRECPLLQTCTYRLRASNVIGFSDFTYAVSGTGDKLPIIG